MFKFVGQVWQGVRYCIQIPNLWIYPKFNPWAIQYSRGFLDISITITWETDSYKSLTFF